MARQIFHGIINFTKIHCVIHGVILYLDCMLVHSLVCNLE